VHGACNSAEVITANPGTDQTEIFELI